MREFKDKMEFAYNLIVTQKFSEEFIQEMVLDKSYNINTFTLIKYHKLSLNFIKINFGIFDINSSWNPCNFLKIFLQSELYSEYEKKNIKKIFNNYKDLL